MDSRAQSGSGISSVDFFLDNRDQGGMSLGSVTPGVLPGPWGGASFETTVTLPNMTGGHALVAYAHSSVDGEESVIAVPIAVNEDPLKAGLTSTPGNTPAASETCSNTTPATTIAPSSMTTAPTTTTPVASTAPAAISPSASTLTFEVGNPSPGDTIHVGNLNIEGVAMDRAAQNGSGIDRVQISLDPRDQGGMALGDATLGPNNQWHATISVPSNVNGMHTLTFYAYSSVTGAESVVSVPVTVAP
jgi:hypothetical protein